MLYDVVSEIKQLITKKTLQSDIRFASKVQKYSDAFSKSSSICM